MRKDEGRPSETVFLCHILKLNEEVVKMKKIGILLLLAVFVGVTFGAVPVFAAAKILKLAEVHPKGYPTEMCDQKFS